MTWVSKLDLKGPPGHITPVNSIQWSATTLLSSNVQTNIFTSSTAYENDHYRISDDGITVKQFTGVVFFRLYIGVVFNGSNVDLVVLKNDSNVWYEQAENTGIQTTVPISGVYPIWVQPGDSIQVKVRPFGASAAGNWSMEIQPLVEISNVG